MDDIRVGSRVRMRKKHPCGSDEWTVFRLGADIGMQCAGCGRRVLLPRSDFQKRRKQVLTEQAEQQREE
jgi:hypothetical protein